MARLQDLRVKLFADGADLARIAELSQQPYIQGFTTNPTLMRKANVRDYRAFAIDVLKAAGGRPVSFEVFSDEFDEMERQALEIASWGSSVYVKIPVTNTRSEFSGPLVKRLSAAGVQLNVTALLTTAQVAKLEGHALLGEIDARRARLRPVLDRRRESVVHELEAHLAAHLVSRSQAAFRRCDCHDRRTPQATLGTLATGLYPRQC